MLEFVQTKEKYQMGIVSNGNGTEGNKHRKVQSMFCFFFSLFLIKEQRQLLLISMGHSVRSNQLERELVVA